MAYETGTATTQQDLFDKLLTFATANGWTQDENSSNKVALHKNNVYVSFRLASDTIDNVSMHQALGYTGGQEPGDHPNDSGNGYNTSNDHNNINLDNERCIYGLGNGPFVSYFFFENDSSPAYIHVVVEISTDVFRHFGFGELDKFGDWTGGEYAYGQYQEFGGSLNAENTHGLDGHFTDTGNNTRRAPTLHMEGLPGQPASSKWGQVWGNTDDTSPPNDSAANDKVNVMGGVRGGPIARHFGVIAPAGSSSGLIPGSPVGLFYRDNDLERIYFLGFQSDVRHMDIRFFAPKQEITVGSDTWVVFPLAQKTTDATNDRTYNSGFAYKKVTA